MSDMESINSEEESQQAEVKEETVTAPENTDEEKLYQCGACGEKFSDFKELRSHFKQIKKGAIGNHESRANCDSFTCLPCKKTFHQIALLRQHAVIHTNNKKFKCSLCDKGFLRKGDLKMHNRSHNGEKPFQCNICLLNFSKNSARVRHVRGHTGEKPYVCDVCGKKFTRPHGLQNHVLIHQGSKDWKCADPDCDKSFRTKDQLSVHKLVHSTVKPITCAYCFKTFKRVRYMKMHQVRVHRITLQTYSCPLCMLVFDDTLKLNQHVCVQLSGAAKYTCSNCSGEYIGMEAFTNHQCEKQSTTSLASKMIIVASPADNTMASQ